MTLSLSRRLPLVAAGLLASAALLTSCSDSTSGVGSANVSVGGSASATVSAAAPTDTGISTTPSDSTGSGDTGGGGTSGGSKSEFCQIFKDGFNTIKNAGTDPKAALAVYDKVAAAAPAEIKADAQYVDDALRNAIDNNDPGDPTKITNASASVARYFATNCN